MRIKMNWIPIKEQFPKIEDGEYFLVRYNKEFKGRMLGLAFCYFHNNRPIQIVLDMKSQEDLIKANEMGVFPSHWMRIPIFDEMKKDQNITDRIKELNLGRSEEYKDLKTMLSLCVQELNKKISGSAYDYRKIFLYPDILNGMPCFVVSFDQSNKKDINFGSFAENGLFVAAMSDEKYPVFTYIPDVERNWIDGKTRCNSLQEVEQSVIDWLDKKETIEKIKYGIS
jgi:hypothetical protein